MRDSFHKDLNNISVQLVEMTRLAGSAMTRATTALLEADLDLAGLPQFVGIFGVWRVRFAWSGAWNGR